MKELSVEVLVSTMNRNDYTFLNDLNLQSDVVVGNQNGSISSTEFELDNHLCRVYTSADKGLANNRNLTLSHALGDICILADDDIRYVDGYCDIVRDAFNKHTDADILIFNVIENPVERYIIRKNSRIRGLEILRYGSVRIAFKNASIKGKIKFDANFGAGGEVPIGEDTIFLNDCLKKKLRIYGIPEFIVELKESESSWFRDYNEQYFNNKGKMYYRMYGELYRIVALQDAVRHRSSYGSAKISYRAMVSGAKQQ